MVKACNNHEAVRLTSRGQVGGSFDVLYGAASNRRQQLGTLFRTVMGVSVIKFAAFRATAFRKR